MARMSVALASKQDCMDVIAKIVESRSSPFLLRTPAIS